MTTVTKNPKNVERGKKAYETHLQKMKDKILNGTPTSSTTDTPTDTPDNTPGNTPTTPSATSIFIAVAVIALVGGAYFYTRKTPVQELQPVEKKVKKWME